MLDHTKPYVEELAGYAYKLDVKLQRLCGSEFSVCCARAYQAVYTTSEWTDQQHLVKTKMGYIFLPSILNAIIGISYYIILKKVILHDSLKKLGMGFLCFSFKKKAAKTMPHKTQVGCFILKKLGFF